MNVFLTGATGYIGTVVAETLQAAGHSVVGLARRFRLTGMTLGLALCMALFIWRNTSAFPPPGDLPSHFTLPVDSNKGP